MNMFWHFLSTVLENGMKDGFFKRCGIGIDKALYAGCKIYRIYRCWKHWILTSFQHSCIPEQNAAEHTGLRLCDVLCACDADAAWRWNKSMLKPKTMTYHAEICRYTNRCELFLELYLLQVRNLNIYCPKSNWNFLKMVSEQYQSTMHQHWEIIWKIQYSAVLPVTSGFNKIIRISLRLLHSKWQSKLIDDIFVQCCSENFIDVYCLYWIIVLSFSHV